MPAGHGRVLLGGRSLWATWLEDTERAVVQDLVDSEAPITVNIR